MMCAAGPVLLVDNDELEAVIARRTLRHMRIENPLLHQKSADEAIVYLHSNSSSKPSVIVLDMNIDGMSALEFLRQIRSDDKLKDIPVVVATTSTSMVDLEPCHRFEVQGYIQRGGSFQDFLVSMRILRQYCKCTDRRFVVSDASAIVANM